VDGTILPLESFRPGGFTAPLWQKCAVIIDIQTLFRIFRTIDRRRRTPRVCRSIRYRPVFFSFRVIIISRLSFAPQTGKSVKTNDYLGFAE
jgi:hypothetical protein